MPPTATPPTCVQFPSDKLTLGAGVAIFHLATSRVIVCYHTRNKYYFLPKGRKNADESLERAAEREGFEESGYRNRLLPVVMKHRATEAEEFAAECQWMQLLPLTTTAQYVLFWFVAETVPKDVEDAYAAETTSGDEGGRVYRPPPSFPRDVTLKQRIAQDTMSTSTLEGKPENYEPRWHEGTAQDEEEMCYRSYLMPVDEARHVLRGSVMEDVVRRGWEGIRARMKIEEEREKEQKGAEGEG